MSAPELRRPSMMVFDLDDTLYAYEPAHRAGLEAMFTFGVAETRVTRDAFVAAWDSARERVKARLGATGGSHSRLLYAQDALELLGFRFQGPLVLALEQEYWRAYIVSMTLRPGTEEFFALLRYHSVPIAIVTDLTSQIQIRKLVHLRLDSLIDHVVVSEETAGDKVSLAPFRLLQDRVRSELLEHVWFVGDGPHDAPVQALIDAGVIVSGHGWIKGASAGGADVSSWDELYAVEAAFNTFIHDDSL